MNGRIARLIRGRAIINPKEKSINRKLYRKLKKEYKQNVSVRNQTR